MTVICRDQDFIVHLFSYVSTSNNGFSVHNTQIATYALTRYRIRDSPPQRVPENRWANLGKHLRCGTLLLTLLNRKGVRDFRFQPPPSSWLQILSGFLFCGRGGGTRGAAPPTFRWGGLSPSNNHSLWRHNLITPLRLYWTWRIHFNGSCSIKHFWDSSLTICTKN